MKGFLLFAQYTESGPSKGEEEAAAWGLAVETPLAPGLCLLIPKKSLQGTCKHGLPVLGKQWEVALTCHQRTFGLTGWVGWDYCLITVVGDTL